MIVVEARLTLAFGQHQPNLNSLKSFSGQDIGELVASAIASTRIGTALFAKRFSNP